MNGATKNATKIFNISWLIFDKLNLVKLIKIR